MPDQNSKIEIGPFSLVSTSHGAQPFSAMGDQLVSDQMYQLTILTGSGPYQHKFDVSLVHFLEIIAVAFLEALLKKPDDGARILLMDYSEMVHVQVCGSELHMSIDGVIKLETFDYASILAGTLKLLQIQVKRAISEGRTKDPDMIRYGLDVPIWHLSDHVE